MCWQAAGLSQRETNDLLDTYVHEQIEEKGAGETHMYVYPLRIANTPHLTPYFKPFKFTYASLDYAQCQPCACSLVI